MQLTFMGTENHTGQIGNSEPWSRQCTLSVCIQTIQSEVMNGEITENITYTTTNQTVNSSKATTELTPVVIDVDDVSHNTSSTPASYTLSAEAMLSIQSWFAQIFTNGSATRTDSAINTSLTSAANAAVTVNLTVGISSGSTFFDSDIVQAFYWNYYEDPSGLDMLVQDVGVSLTVAFRSLAGASDVNGTAWTTETFIHVYWGFVTPLILSILVTAAFLTQMVLHSRVSGGPLWKSSALAMLLHGLDGHTKRDSHDTSDWGVDEKTVGNLRVRLDDSISGGSLKAEMK